MTARDTVQRSDAMTPADALSRGAVYAATCGLLLANAAAGKAVETVVASGPAAALLAGLGFSWAFWIAFAVCVRLALREPRAATRPRDWLLCAAAALAALIPVSQVAAFACTALAAAILVDRDQGRFLKASA